MSNNKELTSTSIKVSCRFRPQKTEEVEKGFKPCVNINNDTNIKLKVYNNTNNN